MAPGEGTKLYCRLLTLPLKPLPQEIRMPFTLLLAVARSPFTDHLPPEFSPTVRVRVEMPDPTARLDQ